MLVGIHGNATEKAKVVAVHMTSRGNMYLQFYEARNMNELVGNHDGLAISVHPVGNTLVADWADFFHCFSPYKEHRSTLSSCVYKDGVLLPTRPRMLADIL